MWGQGLDQWANSTSHSGVALDVPVAIQATCIGSGFSLSGRLVDFHHCHVAAVKHQPCVGVLESGLYFRLLHDGCNTFCFVAGVDPIGLASRGGKAFLDLPAINANKHRICASLC